MQIKPLEELTAMLQNIADPMGIEVVEVAFDNKGNALTIYVDTESGIDLDTCEKFHNAINDPLDEFDPTYDQPYTLNVSSPGLDRPFKTTRDFERNLGKEVEIRLYAPYKGKKFLEGYMTAFDENSVTIQLPKEEIKLNKTKIAKINKAIHFE